MRASVLPRKHRLTQVSILLTPPEVDQLAREARRRRTTRAGLIRALLRTHPDFHTVAPEPAREP